MTEVSSTPAPQARVFTIDRSTWLRGEGSKASLLLRPSDGKMCCLGSIALQCGASPEDIREVTSPSKLGLKLGPDALPEFFNALTSNDSYYMMGENDDIRASDASREAALQRLALKLGWTLHFVDGEGAPRT